MSAIPFVGKCFPAAKDFLAYLDDIKFGAWRPRFITMHHTGGPSLATWKTYAHGTRKVPITDAQWMKNLAAYYGSPPSQGGPPDGPWSAGPHFIFTPDNFCVLSLPDRRGVHAKSFNSLAWAAECVGEFDTEPFTDDLANRYAEGLACLHLAAGLTPDEYLFKVRGLHFHRDDPLTSKTCPGKKVSKPTMVSLILKHMAALGGAGSHDDDEPVPPTEEVARMGTVNTPANDPILNVRDEPSGKSPVTRTLKRGDQIGITGEARNGDTLWYQVIGGDYVAARYVTLAK